MTGMINNMGYNRTTKKKSSGKKTKFSLFSILVAKILLVFVTGFSCAALGLISGAVLGYIKTTPPISDEQLKIKIETTQIFDRYGNTIAELTGSENKNRILVEYGKIPETLRNAFIAVEDERFYQHKGIDFKRSLSAAIYFLTKIGSKHGGSTITQQVVSNITGDKRYTLKRKIQEQWRALQLEKKLDKYQILELYMNIIYMGNSFYGVQSASKGYFGMDVWDISLAQSAALAGITNSPGTYNPYTEKGRKNIRERQEIILKLMLQQGKITRQEYEQALAEDLRFVDKQEGTRETSRQSYFVDQVISEVKNDLIKNGMSREMALTTIYNYGLKIYTTLDQKVQNAIDRVYTDDRYFPLINKTAKNNLEHPQSAMVVISPENGEVLGLYGGYGVKKADNTLNRATQINRQPGSSFKPIAVYAPAIDTGVITAATVIDDAPVYMLGIEKGRYPLNYDLSYGGLTSIRSAIRQSVNVVAAKVWMKIPDISLQYLKKLGINRDDERYVSIAMGGLRKGVNTLSMAAAYVPFVNKGIYYEPVCYTKVVDSDGKVLIDKKSALLNGGQNPFKQSFNTAFSEQTAFIMSDMLKGVVNEAGGTATVYGKIKNSTGEQIPTAGKTGTTSNNIDKWFIGFSKYFIGATWYGYDNIRSVNPIVLTRAEYMQAQKIWNAVMTEIHKDKKPLDFTPPLSGLVKKTICSYSGKIATDLCYRDPRGNAVKEEFFITGTEPSDDDYCKVHVLARVCTDCRDAFGRPLLANEDCPSGKVVEKVFIQRLEPYVPFKPGDPFPYDFIKYELPAGEYCNKH